MRTGAPRAQKRPLDPLGQGHRCTSSDPLDEPVMLSAAQTSLQLHLCCCSGVACLGVHACAYARVPWHTHGSQRQLQGVLSYRVDPRNETPLVRLDSTSPAKPPQPLGVPFY